MKLVAIKGYSQQISHVVGRSETKLLDVIPSPRNGGISRVIWRSFIVTKDNA